MIGRRKKHADPVTEAVHDAVIARDLKYAGGCVAAYITDGDHLCRSRWGMPHLPTDIHELTLDHVQDGGGRMGKRAPSDAAHLVSLCYGAHIATGWATSNRPLLRQYLERVNRSAA